MKEEMINSNLVQWEFKMEDGKLVPDQVNLIHGKSKNPMRVSDNGFLECFIRPHDSRHPVWIICMDYANKEDVIELANTLFDENYINFTEVRTTIKIDSWDELSVDKADYFKLAVKIKKGAAPKQGVLGSIVITKSAYYTKETVGSTLYCVHTKYNLLELYVPKEKYNLETINESVSHMVDLYNNGDDKFDKIDKIVLY